MTRKVFKRSLIKDHYCYNLNILKEPILQRDFLIKKMNNHVGFPHEQSCEPQNNSMLQISNLTKLVPCCHVLQTINLMLITIYQELRNYIS